MTSHMVGKILNVRRAATGIELDVSEHMGMFQPKGIVRLFLDNNATLGLITAVSGKKRKGGDIYAFAAEVFRGRKIEIKVH